MPSQGPGDCLIKKADGSELGPFEDTGGLDRRLLFRIVPRIGLALGRLQPPVW